MLNCTTCNSNAVSIVTVIESRKRSSMLLDTVQLLGCIGGVCALILLIMTVSTASTAVIDTLFTAPSLSSVLELGGETGLSILLIYATLWLLKWCGIAFLLSTVTKPLLPYKTESHQKCICHLCANEWKYVPFTIPQGKQNT